MGCAAVAGGAVPQRRAPSWRLQRRIPYGPADARRTVAQPQLAARLDRTGRADGHAPSRRSRPPAGAPIFSAALIDDLRRLWDERTALFDALDALPHTLCHLDVFPRNVFVRPTAQGEQSVAIDWAFAGQGALGEELAALIGASLAYFEADPATADALEAHCLDGYLRGLATVGWQGNRADVRFGYLAALVLRFALGALAQVLTIALDDRLHPQLERIMGRPFEVVTHNLTRDHAVPGAAHPGGARRLAAR